MFLLGYISFYRRTSGVIARKFRSRVNLLDLLGFLTIKKKSAYLRALEPS